MRRESFRRERFSSQNDAISHYLLFLCNRMAVKRKKTSEWNAKTIAEVAVVLSVSPRMVREYLSRGCPGSPGKYPIPEIIAWCRENVWKPRPTAQGSDDPLLVGSNSPALEKYREQKAAQETIKTLRMQAEYIPTEVARQFMVSVSTAFKEMATDFEKRFGPEASTIFADGLKTAYSIGERHLEASANDR